MKNEALYPLSVVRIAKLLLAFLLIIVVSYFYLQEFNKNPIDFSFLGGAVNVYYLTFALLLCLLSYLVEVIIWKVVLNNQFDRKEITIQEVFAILYASGMFRYLPGRIWILTAQSLWLKKYGITKSQILYINLICIIELIFLSLYLGLVYLVMYTSSLSSSLILILFLFLLLVNILFNGYNKRLMNKVFVLIKKITTIEMKPINISFNSMAVIQLICACSWVLTGLAVYFLAKGLGLEILLLDTIPVAASMCLSWFAGILVVVLPAGVGVREGLMLVMLKPVLAAQTALLLPLVSRLLLLFSEAILGIVAMYLGTKRNVFMLKKNEGSQ